MSLLFRTAICCWLLASSLATRPAVGRQTEGPPAPPPALDERSTAIEETVEEPPPDRPRVTGVFGISLLSQAVFVGSVIGLTHAGGAGMVLTIPLTVIWPSVTALLAWAVGDRSRYYRARYVPLLLASYLSWFPAMVVTAAAMGIGMQTCSGGDPMDEIGCVVDAAYIGGTISFTFIPSGFQALAYSLSRVPRDDVGHSWRAR